MSERASRSALRPPTPPTDHLDAGRGAGDALEGRERGWIRDGGDVGGADGREDGSARRPGVALRLRVRRSDDVTSPATSATTTRTPAPTASLAAA